MYRTSTPSTQSRIKFLQSTSFANVDDDFSDTDCIPSSEDPVSLLPPTYVAKTQSFNPSLSPSSSRHMAFAATPSMTRSSAVSPRSVAVTATSATPSLLLPLAMSSPSASRLHRTPPSSRRRPVLTSRDASLASPSRPHPSLRATIIGNSEADSFPTESPVPSLMSDAYAATSTYRNDTGMPLNNPPKVSSGDITLNALNTQTVSQRFPSPSSYPCGVSTTASTVTSTSTPTSATHTVGVHTPRSLPLLMSAAPARAPRSVRAVRATAHTPTSTQGVGAGPHLTGATSTTTPITRGDAGRAPESPTELSAASSSSFSSSSSTAFSSSSSASFPLPSSSSGSFPSSSSMPSLPSSSPVHPASTTAKATSTTRRSTSYLDPATPARTPRTHATDSTLSPEYLDCFIPKVQRKLAMLTGAARERYQRRLLKQRTQYHVRKNGDPQNNLSRKRGRAIKIDFVRAPAAPPALLPAVREPVAMPTPGTCDNTDTDVRRPTDLAKESEGKSSMKEDVTDRVADRATPTLECNTASAAIIEGMAANTASASKPTVADAAPIPVDTASAVADTIPSSTALLEPSPSCGSSHATDAEHPTLPDDADSTDAEVAMLRPPVKRGRRAGVQPVRVKPVVQARRRSRRHMGDDEGGEDDLVSKAEAEREVNTGKAVERVKEEQKEHSVMEQEDKVVKLEEVKTDDAEEKSTRKPAKVRMTVHDAKHEPMPEPVSSRGPRRSARNVSTGSSHTWKDAGVKAGTKRKSNLQTTPTSPSSSASSDISSQSTSVSPTTTSSHDASTDVVADADTDTDTVTTPTSNNDNTVIFDLADAQSQEVSGTSHSIAQTDSRMVDHDIDDPLCTPTETPAEASKVSEASLDLLSPPEKAATASTTAAKRRASRRTATPPTAQPDEKSASFIAEQGSGEDAAAPARSGVSLVDVDMAEESLPRSARSRDGQSHRGRTPRPSRATGRDVIAKTTQNLDDAVSSAPSAFQEAVKEEEASAGLTASVTSSAASATIPETYTSLSAAAPARAAPTTLEDTTTSPATAVAANFTTPKSTGSGVGVDSPTSPTLPDGHSISDNLAATVASSCLSPVAVSTTCATELGDREDECFLSLLRTEKEQMLALVEQHVTKVESVYDRIRHMEDRLKGQLTHVKIEFSDMLSSLLRQYRSIPSSPSPDAKTQLEALKAQLKQKHTEYTAKIKAISLRLQQKHAVLQALDMEMDEEVEL